jgi:negative regulator of flagellin synthesis FlgM
MKVNQSQGQASAQGLSEASGAKKKEVHEAKKQERAAALEARNTSGAKAEISAKGKEFAQAKAVAANAPDVREDKIAELKAKIASGNYSVDTDRVADRMVDDHLKMAGIGA